VINKDWIFNSIESAALTDPNRQFVTTELGQIAMTYKDVYDLIQSINNLFSKNQISYEEFGLVCVQRGIFQAALIVSLLAQGRPALFIEVNSKKDEIIRMLNNLSCRFLIFEKSLFEKLQSQLLEFKPLEFGNFAFTGSQNIIFLIREVKLSTNSNLVNIKDLRWFLHTSGTTGHSKPVAITSENLQKRTASESKIFQIQEHSLLLNVLSLCHDLGLNQLLTALFTRSTVEIYSVRFAADFLKRLEIVNYHGITGIPNVWKNIIQLTAGQNAVILGKFYITISGGSLKKHEIEILHSIFPEARIIKTYGQTETFRSLYEISNPAQVTSFLAKPYMNVQVSLLRVNAAEEKEDEGELVHFGDGLFAGYLMQTESDESRFILGQAVSESLTGQIGFKTGDYFRKVNNQYEFLGRRDDLIKINGRRFYLSEVENCILALNFVSDVIVCRDEFDKYIYSYEVLVAFVILKKNTENAENEIKIQCIKNLDNYKVPNHILILEKFPITTTGKTDRMALLELLSKKVKNDKA
jgi:acyl-coenzyme A synthetase/AMP-(fatty) acid ligase